MRVSRRAFVGGLAGLAVSTGGLVLLGGCGVSRAGSTHEKVPAIGVLTSSSIEEPQWAGFHQGLAEHGWRVDQNMTISWRQADNQLDLLKSLADELVGLPVDLLATSGSPATRAAQQATSTIPIVFCGIGDPVGSRIVQSLARPGGNATGTTQSVAGTALSGKRLSLLSELVPGLARIADLQNFGNSTAQATFAEHVAVAHQLGVQIEPFDVRAESDLEPAFTAASAWKAEGLLIGGDALFVTLNDRVVQLAARERLPAMFPNKASGGGLISYGANLSKLYERAVAGYIDPILRGAKPDELPVEQATTFELVLNRATAQALGLTIPSDVAAQVTEWVE
jgi:putative ABC transport system substrate-binding protein